jgi:2-polyprenyl-6-methoxyphenol hydroxylase-like FAD-dependent oxidoreductase
VRLLSFPLRRISGVEFAALKPVSDAAHIVHPLAGQGVNLGFGDVVVLCKAIVEGLETGQDIGNK